MFYRHPAVQSGPGDDQIVEKHHITNPRGEGDDRGTDRRGRRWYHPRPEPRRRTDLVGFNSTWWMALGWLVLILLVVFPFPFWSW